MWYTCSPVSPSRLITLSTYRDIMCFSPALLFLFRVKNHNIVFATQICFPAFWPGWNASAREKILNGKCHACARNQRKRKESVDRSCVILLYLHAHEDKRKRKMSTWITTYVGTISWARQSRGAQLSNC